MPVHEPEKDIDPIDRVLAQYPQVVERSSETVLPNEAERMIMTKAVDAVARKVSENARDHLLSDSLMLVRYTRLLAPQELLGENLRTPSPGTDEKFDKQMKEWEDKVVSRLSDTFTWMEQINYRALFAPEITTPPDNRVQVDGQHSIPSRRTMSLYAKLFPMHIFGSDGLGRPIVGMRINDLQLSGLGELEIEQIEVLEAQRNAFLIDRDMHRRSHARNWRVYKQILIVDALGLTSLISPLTTQRLRQRAEMVVGTGGTHFPESTHATYVLNAPFAFRAIWAIVKRMIPPQVAREVRVFKTAEECLAALCREQEVTKSELPVWLGGGHQGVDILECLEAELLGKNAMIAPSSQKSVDALRARPRGRDGNSRKCSNSDSILNSANSPQASHSSPGGGVQIRGSRRASAQPNFQQQQNIHKSSQGHAPVYGNSMQIRGSRRASATPRAQPQLLSQIRANNDNGEPTENANTNTNRSVSNSNKDSRLQLMLRVGAIIAATTALAVAGVISAWRVAAAVPLFMCLAIAIPYA
jgi:hypothetical protein